MAIINISSVIGNGIQLLNTTQTRKTNFLAYQGATYNLNFQVFDFDGTVFDLTGWYPKGAMSIDPFDSCYFLPLTISIAGDPTDGILNWYIDAETTLNLIGDGNYTFNIDIVNGASNLDWNSITDTWDEDTTTWSLSVPSQAFTLRVLEGILRVQVGVNY